MYIFLTYVFILFIIIINNKFRVKLKINLSYDLFIYLFKF